MKFEILSSEAVYHGRVFDVYRDQLRYPDGRSFQMDVVKHSGAVAIVPVDAEGQLILIRQYRHAVTDQLIELPAGTLEAGEEPKICAQRELREEVGLAAKELIPLGEVWLAPGYSNERMHIFLARNLSPDPLPQDEDEVLESVQMSPQQAFDMIAAGEISDAKTQLGLFLAKPYLSL